MALSLFLVLLFGFLSCGNGGAGKIAELEEEVEYLKGLKGMTSAERNELLLEGFDFCKWTRTYPEAIEIQMNKAYRKRMGMDLGQIEVIAITPEPPETPESPTYILTRLVDTYMLQKTSPDCLNAIEKKFYTDSAEVDKVIKKLGMKRR